MNTFNSFAQRIFQMKYSQWKAMWAITIASLQGIRRSPSAIVFSFAFPLIFILAFGFMGGAGRQVYRIAISPDSDTLNELYAAISHAESIRIVHFSDQASLDSEMKKGKLAGILSIGKTSDSTGMYSVSLKSTTASNDKWPQLRSFLMAEINEVSDRKFPGRARYALLDFDPARDIASIREYKSIDFILPGMLGFSLLSAGIFGVAFMFYSLRQQLVLKRFFATPVSRTGIILGEGISRVIFQLTTAVVIIGVGYLFFGFTLVHGWLTFLQMLCLCFIGLVIFMGCGFIVSGIAKNESTIPPIANIFTLPQFLLGGTFFSPDAFPKWLQPISRALPLTHFNNALRSIAFEGQSLWDIRAEICILCIWGIVIYIAAIKLFRWE